MQNRKILEELQIKKQLLLKQGAANNLNSSPQIPLSINTGNTLSTPFSTAQAANLIAESHNQSAQRAALHSANSQSFAFFITQDSSFGNLILPVLPRFDK